MDNLGFLIAVVNGVLLLGCIAAVKRASTWESHWGRTVVLVVFALGALLFGGCTVAWTLISLRF